MPNVELLRKALEHITAHPEEWDQAAWAYKTDCGTSCCLAGHVVTLAGKQIDFDPDSNMPAHRVVGEAGSIDQVAANLLDIEPLFEAQFDYEDHLFHEHNTLADLWHKAAELTDGEIEIPAGIG